MIVINLKKRSIEIPDLNDDCNFVLQTCNIQDLTYKNIIQSALSFIAWEYDKLDILDNYELIDWDIYSFNDLDFELLNKKINTIKFDRFLAFIEQKYKILPIEYIQKIKIFIDKPDEKTHIELNKTILKTRTAANKEFYYCSDFLKTFSFVFDTLDDNVCKKYLMTKELVNIFLDHVSPNVIKHFIQTIVLDEDIIHRIIEIIDEKNEIFNIIFEYQKLSYEFILKGATNKLWSYNNWIKIMKNQILNENELFELFKLPSGETIMQICCQYKKLNEIFIKKYWNILNQILIQKYQLLSYEFVKNNIELFNLKLLSTNTLLKFKIIEINDNDDSLVEIPSKYIIINEHNNYDRIIFVDRPSTI